MIHVLTYNPNESTRRIRSTIMAKNRKITMTARPNVYPCHASASAPKLTPVKTAHFTDVRSVR